MLTQTDDGIDGINHAQPFSFVGQGTWSQLVPAALFPVRPLTFSITLISVGPVCCGDPAVWLEERQRRPNGALHYMPFRQTTTCVLTPHQQSLFLSVCLLLSIFTPFSIKTHCLNTQATLCTAWCDGHIWEGWASFPFLPLTIRSELHVAPFC